jgi:hypothetical protein
MYIIILKDKNYYLCKFFNLKKIIIQYTSLMIESLLKLLGAHLPHLRNLINGILADARYEEKDMSEEGG